MQHNKIEVTIAFILLRSEFCNRQQNSRRVYMISSFPDWNCVWYFSKRMIECDLLWNLFWSFLLLKLLDLWDLFWYHSLHHFQEGEGKADDRMGGDGDIPSISAMNSLDSPMTPCPSAVEYVTPVFAKNYQGVWRYVVQIPYEGYFTQTVEVVKCL